MTINLPNGTLKSKEMPDLGAGPSTLLTGQIICLLCGRLWDAELLIYAGPPPDFKKADPFDTPFVTCPDCDAPIMNVGARRGGAILRRAKKKRRHRKTT